MTEGRCNQLRELQDTGGAGAGASPKADMGLPRETPTSGLAGAGMGVALCDGLGQAQTLLPGGEVSKGLPSGVVEACPLGS